jgi:3-methyladenine DNA glycosylase AlkD
MPAGPYVDSVVSAFSANANQEKADGMRAYMKNQFPFCGLSAPERTALLRQCWAGLPELDEKDLVTAVAALWVLPEREYQYAGVALIRRHIRHAGPGLMPVAETLIVDKSWWDTVDELATHVVGPLALRYPGLRADVARWIDSDNLWLARTAIIYQNGYKERTDPGLLFDYCLRRVDDKDFFIRKAIGWALREYSKTDPDAVRGFVVEHESRLSGLSRREALRRIGTT